jgi:hypothetical protein
VRVEYQKPRPPFVSVFLGVDALRSTVLGCECRPPPVAVLNYRIMVDVDTGRFTVGVFQDAAWARKGLDALKNIGIPSEAITIIAREGAEAGALIEQTFGGSGDRLDLANIGPVLARGPLVAALQGPASDLPKLGIAGTMRRVGFQAHDGRIFETLIARGGVLVAIHSEPRAADSLAVLHSYGGGNAAIGAWTGRV